jgi:Rad9
MDCTVNDQSGVRTLSRLITSAAKIGEDVTFTAAADGLHVRTLNASHSVCAHYILRPPIFAHYSMLDAKPNADPTARVSCRALIPIFRQPSAIDRARITIDPARDRIVVDIVSRTGTKKSFRLPVHDAPAGQAVYDKSACTSFFQTRPRFLIDVLANFHARLDELTFSPSTSALRVSSFVDDVASTANHMLRTEMAVDAREFDTYRIVAPLGQPVSTLSPTAPPSAPVPSADSGDISPLTFYCKPFRAVLEFCEALDAPISAWFQASGTPILFGVDLASPGSAPYFTATFIFATRLVQDSQTQTLASYATSGTGSRSGTPLVVQHPGGSASTTGKQLGRRRSATEPGDRPPAKSPTVPIPPGLEPFTDATAANPIVLTPAPRPMSAGSRNGASASISLAPRRLEPPTSLNPNDVEDDGRYVPENDPDAGMIPIDKSDRDDEEDDDYVDGTPPPPSP